MLVDEIQNFRGVSDLGLGTWGGKGEGKKRVGQAPNPGFDSSLNWTCTILESQ